MAEFVVRGRAAGRYPVTSASCNRLGLYQRSADERRTLEGPCLLQVRLGVIGKALYLFAFGRGWGKEPLKLSPTTQLDPTTRSDVVGVGTPLFSIMIHTGHEAYKV